MFRLLTVLLLSLSLFVACEGKKKEKEEDPVAGIECVMEQEEGCEEMAGEEAMPEAGMEMDMEMPEEGGEMMPEEMDMEPEACEDPDCEDEGCAC